MAEQNETTTDIDHAARVAKGAALLDAKRPGWERELDLSTLDISDPCRCVTAQLSGINNFKEGQLQLGLNNAAYTAHGFNVDDTCDCCRPEDLPEGYDQTEAYATLNTLWREVIEGRLSASPEPAVD